MQNLIKYKDLYWQLTFREINARYKQSVLGYAWAIIVPLMNLIVLSIVFSYLFRVPTGNIPYPIFLFVALVPWTFFSNSLVAATGSIMENGALITKVKLPREIIPLSAIGSKSIDLILTFLILLVLLFIYKVEFHQTFILVPFIFIFQLTFMVGVAFFLSATNVFFRDIGNVLGIFLTIWMYLTPVIYSPQMIPDNLKLLFYLNPMTSIINAYRDTILYGNLPNFAQMSYVIFISGLLLVLGYLYFKKRSKQFADVI
ncbi:ABC transporter permease [Candidatus Microgenomates bacterium]|nr:ABC transporter permease [Candidatus Microgenomates bacterium]